MTPTPAAVELIASQKEFIAVATRQLLAAQLEMEKPNPYWNDIFNNVYSALGRVDTLRTVDATLQRMALDSLPSSSASDVPSALLNGLQDMLVNDCSKAFELSEAMQVMVTSNDSTGRD